MYRRRRRRSLARWTDKRRRDDLVGAEMRAQEDGKTASDVVKVGRHAVRPAPAEAAKPWWTCASGTKATRRPAVEQPDRHVGVVHVEAEGGVEATHAGQDSPADGHVRSLEHRE